MGLQSGETLLRAAARRVAEVLMGDTSDSSLPPNAKLSRFSECLLFSDFLEPVAEMAERFEEIAAQGVRGPPGRGQP